MYLRTAIIDVAPNRRPASPPLRSPRLAEQTDASPRRTCFRLSTSPRRTGRHLSDLLCLTASHRPPPCLVAQVASVPRLATQAVASLNPLVVPPFSSNARTIRSKMATSKRLDLGEGDG
ncbi:unnamed protein product [Cuscuta europaea]|uniref:Uncharacterized protein n=1 Tax=Cuscuta europaea TaxID=41803 RepID=A0A9P0Z8Y0_CUSEU|nr:unnamed protein product [Cuscuta europaea]